MKDHHCGDKGKRKKKTKSNITIHIKSRRKDSPPDKQIGNADTVSFANDVRNKITVTFLGVEAEESL